MLSLPKCEWRVTFRLGRGHEKMTIKRKKKNELHKLRPYLNNE